MAEEREWFHKNHPDVDRVALNRRFGSPYAKTLNYHKGFANEVIDVIGVNVDGSTANLTVSTSGGGKSLSGEFLSYSKAHIEMAGEGAYWKVKRISSSALLYDQPPRTP